ncbi:Pentatricopeptide repeat [Dillenia turbinata]|uniref:Pentatricopeptide repeat n=1 Tax=Dillenia turbinata TaxID=194707 RepID=A0AAN8UEV8_9MAGN
MPQRNTVPWNAMIRGYFQNGHFDKEVNMFNQMPESNVIAYDTVIAGLIQKVGIDGAKELKRFSGEMSDLDVASWTIMLSGLVSAGRITEARALFDDMPVKDIQAWKTIKGGYVEFGQVNDSMMLYMLMPQKCRLTWNSLCLELMRNGLVKETHALIEQCSFGDIVAFTNVIVGYFGLGEVENAIKLFELMPTQDATMWNVVIFGLGENDYGEEGLKFFIRMNGPSPDEATFTSMMTICADLPTLHLRKQAYAQVIKTGFDYFVKVSVAVVTMYERCGNLDSALLAFSSMPNQDIISWNAIVCGFIHHGNGEKALEMLRKMRLTYIQPNHVTFVDELSSCSHTGLVDQGKQCFDFMSVHHEWDLMQMEMETGFLETDDVSFQDFRVALECCCKLYLNTKLGLTEVHTLNTTEDQMYWLETERWLKQRYAEFHPCHEQNGNFRILGYQWCMLHFNDNTRYSTFKLMAAESDLGSLWFMPQAHCLAVPHKFHHHKFNGLFAVIFWGHF